MTDRITYNCGSCGRQLAVQASAAGCKARCPACNTINTVPDAASADATPPPPPAAPASVPPAAPPAEPPSVPLAAPPSAPPATPPSAPLATPPSAPPAKPTQASEPIRHYLVEVAGADDVNPDGTSRQEIVRQCRPGEILQLVQRSDTPDGTGAAMVCRQSGEQVGYLSAKIMQGDGLGGMPMQEYIERGFQAAGWVVETIEVEHAGLCKLSIAVALVPPGTTSQAVAAYVQGVGLSYEVDDTSQVSHDKTAALEQPGVLGCEMCGGPLAKAKMNRHGKRGVQIAMVLFIAGLIMLVVSAVKFSWPLALVAVLGWAGAVTLARRQKIWYCKQCRHTQPREQ